MKTGVLLENVSVSFDGLDVVRGANTNHREQSMDLNAL